MGGQFRQGKRKKAKACLNGRPNQTGQAGKCQSVSEWEAKSDRAGGKVPKHVRMRVKIRQGKRKKAKACPNGRPNQTGQAGKCQSVSECEANLDRASVKKPKRVRMRGQIRQGKRKSAKACPNAGQNQTRQA